MDIVRSAHAAESESRVSSLLHVKPNLMIGLYQLESVLGRPDLNLERAVHLVEFAADAGADIVVFPEMYLTGYMAQMESRQLAEPLDGPSLAEIRKVCASREVFAVMGMPTISSEAVGFINNSAVVVGPHGVVGAHHKLSLPTFHIGDILLTEGNYWSPGTELRLFDIHGWKVALNICADAWFPEIPRTQAIQGAHVIITISAGPSIWKEGWPMVLATRAMENGVYQAYSNVVGTQRNVEFFGGNVIIEPSGAEVIHGPIGKEALTLGPVNISTLYDARTQQPRLRPGYDRPRLHWLG